VTGEGGRFRQGKLEKLSWAREGELSHGRVLTKGFTPLSCARTVPKSHSLPPASLRIGNDTRNQIVLVNLGILAELAVEYFRNVPTTVLAGCGIFFLLLANLIFFFRWQKLRKPQ
jgi:hypothetical protein